MVRWSRANVEALAPDDKSMVAARKLARPGPWSETGSTDTLVWGKCQGSGSTPYQVSVDLTGPAAKCSCPSRKFPCKHGLALLLLWVEGDGVVADGAAPDHVGEWAAGRADRAGRGADRPQSRGTDPPVDPAAQAKRLEQRLALMTAGANDFELWLGDLYRHGFAAARQQPYAFWDEAAARLTDAQLPGLAARVRSFPGRLVGRADWVDDALGETGRWFAAVRAWQRRELLSPEDFGNLRAFVGWAMATEEVRAGDVVDDTWMIEAVHRTEDGRLQMQRTWIRAGSSGERFVVLDFAAGGTALGLPQVVGALVTSPVAVWPGSGVRRAMFAAETHSTAVTTTLHAPTTIDEALAQASLSLAANPFVDQVPVVLRAGIEPVDGGARVVDEAGRHLRLVHDVDPWPIVALTGDHAVGLFCELEEGCLRPLTLELNGQLVPV